MSRVGSDAAGHAGTLAALAASPKIPSIWLRISIARPFDGASLGQNR